MVKIAHIGDPHVFIGIENVKDLIGKRITGYFNLLLSRGRKYNHEQFDIMLKKLESLDIDYVVIPGDIGCLGLKTEFELAKKYLSKTKFWPDKIILVPGNHDYYTTDSYKLNYLKDSFPQIFISSKNTNTSFPIVKIFEDVAFIGLNSCLPTFPFLAYGIMDQKQLDNLKSILEQPYIKDKMIIFVIHHPPVFYDNKLKHWHRGFRNYDLFIDLLKMIGQNFMILSGHWHIRREYNLEPELKGKIFVAPSISKVKGIEQLNKAGIFLYTIENKKLIKYEFLDYLGEKDDKK